MSTVLLGFTRLEQVDENMKGMELYKKWTPEIEKRCNEILNNEPERDLDWRKLAPQPNRREVVVPKKVI